MGYGAAAKVIHCLITLGSALISYWQWRTGLLVNSLVLPGSHIPVYADELGVERFVVGFALESH